MMHKTDANYVFYELTRSICPDCRRVIDAQVILRDNKVYMRKRCPTCGPFEALVYGDAGAYVANGKYNKPGTIPLAFGSERDRGCPYDCGLCPDHEQHTCLGIIEVNSVCNMDCPLCFSTAGPGFSLTLEEVESMLDDFVRTEGTPEVVQFSGGEPTIHPQIVDFVKAAKARGIRFVMINTNGKRIARDDKFVAQLAEVKPAFYFQFDGFERRTSLTLRGDAQIVEERIRALDRLALAGLHVTLVPAIERGVNEHELGRIIDFAISHPAVRGMVSDFIPVPCCFPTCNAVTYAFVDGDRVVPLPRIVNVYEYLDYITNRVVPDFSLEIRGALEGLWSSSSVAGSQKSLDQLSLSCQACGLPDVVTVGDLADHMLMIMAQDFMDPWTFNQKNLMKCCKEFLLPGGKQIPFCAYNTIGYREQARAQLEAMEPGRRRARAEGRRFEPTPVTFSFAEPQG